MLVDYLKEKTAAMVAIAEKKNADYTGGDTDEFFNFTAVESLDVMSAEEGIFVRMIDKFMRVRSFIKKGVLEVKDETVEDTLIDLANYSLILAALIKKKKDTHSLFLAASKSVPVKPVVRRGKKRG